MDAAASWGMPVTMRGAGTSLAGQSVGEGLVVDSERARSLRRSTQTRAPRASARASCWTTSTGPRRPTG